MLLIEPSILSPRFNRFNLMFNMVFDAFKPVDERSIDRIPKFGIGVKMTALFSELHGSRLLGNLNFEF